MKITFTNVFTLQKEVMALPGLASKNTPEWYKSMPSYTTAEGKIPSENGGSVGTVKKCMPVFDAMTAGYILHTPVDLHVKQKNGGPYYIWPGFNAIEFHAAEQTLNHPAKKQDETLLSAKFMNPWAIKTPPGYSVLVTAPMHRDSVFTILPGIVDTDQYTRPINFPFVLNDIKFEGLIPAGTPMAQVIPFKRESWKMEIGNEQDIKQQNQVAEKMQTLFWDRYKRLWWNKKEYK